jgi:hypothetical protein
MGPAIRYQPETQVTRQSQQPVKPSEPLCIEPGAPGAARAAAGVVVWMAFLSGVQAPATAETQKVTPRVFDDGSAEAPRGAPQLPTLLSGYAARPPWAVAGVEYLVGYPAHTVLKDPSTIGNAGVSVDAAHGIVYVTGSNVTLDGYDFATAGGYGIVVQPGVSETVIQDCNFRVGSNHLVPIHAGTQVGNLTVQYNTIDGGGGQDEKVWALVNYNGSGTFVAKFNSFFDAPADAIDFGVGSMATIIKYNLFVNLGTAPGSHPDAVQYAGVHSTHSVEAFNTIYQPNPSGMQGIQLEAQLGSTLKNAELVNNVILAKGPPIKMSYSIAVGQDRDPGNTIDGVVVAHNYIDFSGAYGPFYQPTGTNLAFVDNVNMLTGTRIAAPLGTATSKQVK